MSTKSREVLFGSRVRLREMQAEAAREKAVEALREANRAECQAWSLRMEGFGGPAQPSPTIAQCLNGGLGWLEVKCHRCGIQASIPLDAIRRPRETPLWKLEASFGCRSCRTPRYKPRAYMVKLTEAREIALSPWHDPETRRSCSKLRTIAPCHPCTAERSPRSHGVMVLWCGRWAQEATVLVS